MNPEWYEQSFGEDYLIVYRHRNRAMATQEMQQVIQWLELTPSDHILDLCCGTGRHSITLAKQNLHVVGLDLSNTLLQRANQLTQQEGLNIPFVHGDMRQLPFVDDSFDVVLNLFTSFGYFREDDENQQVLREIVRVLRPEGRFLIDFLNREAVIRQLVPESEREEEGVWIREVRWIDGDFVHKTIWIRDDRGERRYEERVKMYTYEKMVDMMTQAGMSVTASYGSFRGEPYQKDSKRMIIVGKVRK
ncbi:class I SAM-dependent methyltransferase [Thermoflavimicrobium dichotomicum]|uniref:Methyltransferase domain-containing protein n=1 Tax=Thermoflavimicrobium dichotomicum TaxID=46223 RepID=A0A1I3LSH2_9BACL|nr:class I SAM-dependent methyltransferase [Thermoflavimicrobium dichotomicum]SFI87396.1 Methyltransferase domain-containing protein [Thermoflavimicrobium dichotomicum]